MYVRLIYAFALLAVSPSIPSPEAVSGYPVHIPRYVSNNTTHTHPLLGPLSNLPKRCSLTHSRNIDSNVPGYWLFHSKWKPASATFQPCWRTHPFRKELAAQPTMWIHRIMHIPTDRRMQRVEKSTFNHPFKWHRRSWKGFRAETTDTKYTPKWHRVLDVRAKLIDSYERSRLRVAFARFVERIRRCSLAIPTGMHKHRAYRKRKQHNVIAHAQMAVDGWMPHQSNESTALKPLLAKKCICLVQVFWQTQPMMNRSSFHNLNELEENTWIHRNVGNWVFFENGMLSSGKVTKQSDRYVDIRPFPYNYPANQSIIFETHSTAND